MFVLPDVLARDLDVVFCGTAPGTRSAQAGAYYASPGNKFWPTLHATGLTPHRFAPVDFRDVLKHRIGLTDLAKHVSGADSVLKPHDFDTRALRRIVARYEPRYVAFTSKRAAQEFFGATVDYGLHPYESGSTRFFVLSSPSGLATGFWQEGRHWHELAKLVRSIR
jgi:double-stranded uracil-DNA glycosylase